MSIASRSRLRALRLIASVLLLAAILACGGEETESAPTQPENTAEVAPPAEPGTFEHGGFRCDLREFNGTCEEPTRLNLALGEEFGRSACTNRTGQWSAGTCPTENELGVCQSQGGARTHHYAGGSRTAESAERNCGIALGTWTAAQP